MASRADLLCQKSPKIGRVEWTRTRRKPRRQKLSDIGNACPRIAKSNSEAADLHIIILQNCNLCSFLLNLHILFLYSHLHEAITPGYSCSCTESHSKSAKNYGKLRDKNFTSMHSKTCTVPIFLKPTTTKEVSMDTSSTDNFFFRTRRKIYKLMVKCSFPRLSKIQPHRDVSKRDLHPPPHKRGGRKYNTVTFCVQVTVPARWRNHRCRRKALSITYSWALEGVDHCTYL